MESDHQNPQNQDTHSPLMESMLKNLQEENMKVDILKENKMSDILTEFIEPYIDETHSNEQLLTLLGLGVIAWNLSFSSRREQRNEIELFLQENSFFAGGMDHQLKEDMKNLIGQLIARKKRYFAKHKRLIIDFQVQEDQDGELELFVLSQPIHKK